jgi:hypothetical protein
MIGITPSKKTKVLVLGNGVSINDIDFSRLDPSVITFGINRIWLKHIPNYFFFQDPDIIFELEKQPEYLVQLKNKSTIFASDWLRVQAKKNNMTIPQWVKTYDRINKRSFVDSITHGMQILSRSLLNDKSIVFYIAGVPLTWKEPSHFWKELSHDGLNKNGAAWYAPRFDKIFNNFVELRSKGIQIVSVTPESRLNKLFRHENIDNLYSKS